MTIVRDMVGGTLGIAVDLWDGEVTVGAITAHGPADREGTLIQGDIIRAINGKLLTAMQYAGTTERWFLLQPVWGAKKRLSRGLT